MSLAAIIAATLASPDPELRHISDHRFLARRVRVLLDGRDVTKLCRAFSIPTGRVLLMVEEEGKKLLQFTCACGIARGRRPPGVTVWIGDSVCRECMQTFEVGVAEEIRSGHVEVIPL